MNIFCVCIKKNPEILGVALCHRVSLSGEGMVNCHTFLLVTFFSNSLKIQMRLQMLSVQEL